jgi:peptidoglycan/LPS O-acetylase OafA/YrhL
MKITYFKSLDGVRAIAALMVMIFHFFQNIKLDSALLKEIIKFSTFGQTGVTLFFVLSGFLITRILLSNKLNKNYFKNFYLKRALRIFPLYYLYLVIYFILFPLLSDSNFISLNEQLYFYFYLQNIPFSFNNIINGPIHFWSLAVEEHFYIFWPILIYFLNRKWINILILFIIIFAFILRVIMLNNHLESFYFTLTRFDSLAIGSLIALFEKKIIQIQSMLFFFLSLFFFFTYLFFGDLLETFPFHTIIDYFSNLIFGKIFNILPIKSTINYLIISMFYFSVISYIISLKNNSFLNIFLKIKPLTYTGKISYGLYVYHPFAYFFIEKYLPSENWIGNLIMGFTLSFIIASLSYHLFEVKFLNLKQKFI